MPDRPEGKFVPAQVNAVGSSLLERMFVLVLYMGTFFFIAFTAVNSGKLESVSVQSSMKIDHK